MTSCLSLRTLDYNSGTLDESNFEGVCGLYQAQPDSMYKRNLAECLLVNYYLNYQSTKIDSFYDTLEVKIETIGSDQLKVVVYRNLEEESSQILKGRLKNGYFVLDQQYQYDSEIPVMLGISTRQKSRITLNEQGDLIVDFKELTNLKLILLPLFFHKLEFMEQEFKKVKTAGNNG